MTLYSFPPRNKEDPLLVSQHRRIDVREEKQEVLVSGIATGGCQFFRDKGLRQPMPRIQDTDYC